MVLEEYRQRVQPWVARLADGWVDWSPAALSGVALGLCAAAGLLAFLVRFSSPLLFLPVAVLIFVGGIFDVLDGEVARRTGRASARGDFLDHVLDRYADIFLVLGFAASGFANPILGLLALVSLLLTSYMGTQAQAVGAGRIYAGMLSRADRLVLLAAAAFVEFLFAVPWPWAPSAPFVRWSVNGFSFTVLDVLFVYFVLAGQYTALTRARRAWSALPPGKAETPSAPPPT
jgi:archaetidylinositol phosphate synthase